MNLQNLLASIEQEGIPEEEGRKGKYITKVGTQFCIRSDGIDQNFGCWPDRAKAEAVMSGKSFIEPDIAAKKDFSPVTKLRDKQTMKVNQTTGEIQMPKVVKSGGPGSGRHKETLTKLGYKSKGTMNEGKTHATLHQHPVSNRQVLVHDSGAWATRKGSGVSILERGTNMHDYYSRYHPSRMDQAVVKKITATGTSEGAQRAWDTRGRGKAINTEGKNQQYLHKGFHNTLTKLGYNFQHTDYTAKAATPNSQYYNPKSQRQVNVQENGMWDSKKGDGFTPRESGNTPGEFFEKYHMPKKQLEAGGPGSGRKPSTNKPLKPVKPFSEESPKTQARIRSNPRQTSLFGPGHTKELQKYYKMKAVIGPPMPKFNIGSPFKKSEMGMPKAGPNERGAKLKKPIGHTPNAKMPGGNGFKHRLPNPQLQAGGPGSGRHQEILKQHGWKYQGGTPFHDNMSYERGRGERIDFKNKGSWAHYVNFEKVARGKTADKLESYLSEKKLEADGNYGEPMAGSMQHAHLDTNLWFHPPSLKNPDRIPTDDPKETNDRFLDVTKRNSKDTKEQRMKLLKRSAPGGNPPMVPVHTTAVSPFQNSYSPMYASKLNRINKRKMGNAGMYRAFGSAKI
jgi:hypothetical protein